ncbi:MAG TPA: hypothetical protein VIH99_10535 [Bdellovibrionota bacterium]|jgi:hypothetical protein
MKRLTKRDKRRSRRCSASCPPRLSRLWLRSFSGEASSSGWPSTTLSLRRERRGALAGEAGFFLPLLASLLLLLLVLLLGGLRIAASSQAAMALQSRLDVCAVRLAEGRKRLLEQLVRSNRALELTVVGVYASRGVKLAGPIGAVVGGLSEAALLQANRGLAFFQTGAIQWTRSREATILRCPSSPFSASEAFCLTLPELGSAFRRERTLFPDVAGALTSSVRTPGLARILCRGGRRLRTTVVVRGDSRLRNGGFRDEVVE